MVIFICIRNVYDKDCLVLEALTVVGVFRRVEGTLRDLRKCIGLSVPEF